MDKKPGNNSQQTFAFAWKASNSNKLFSFAMSTFEPCSSGGESTTQELGGASAVISRNKFQSGIAISVEHKTLIVHN